MTEITRLLNEDQSKEFEEIMNFIGSTTLDDVEVECISAMLILAHNYNVQNIGKNKFFKMYGLTIKFVHREYDLQFADSVFTKKGFFEFMKTYFPYWRKPLSNHRD
ncbi:MAG: hypothetical protein ACK5LL_04745 [Suipraeoptans sp.]